MEKQAEKPMFRLGLDAFKARPKEERTYRCDLFYPEKHVAKYSKDRLYLGTIIGKNEDRIYPHQKYSILTKNDDGSLASTISVYFGMRGCGKTMAMRADLSRTYKSGFHCAYLDIKGEMRSNLEPFDVKSFKGGKLGENEVPEAIPTIMAIPLFLKKYHKVLSKEDIVFQFSLYDLTLEDLNYLFKPSTDNYKNILVSACNLIQKKKINNLEELRHFLQEQIKHPSTINTINLAINSLQEHELFGEKHPLDITSLIEDSVLVLDLSDYDKLKEQSLFYVGLFIRKITDLRKNKVLKKPLVFFIDEFHAFCPANETPYSRERIVYMVNVSRTYSISARFATQDPSQLPDTEILRQIRYFYLTNAISYDVLCKILKDAGIWEFGDTQRNKWNGALKNMPKYSWMCIDRFNKQIAKIVKFYLPLCAHQTEARF